MTKKKEQSFEESMTKLEQVVNKLSEGQMPLDKSIAAFEDGMKLVHECEGRLKDAQGKVEQLVKDASGKTMKAPLNTGE